MSEFVSDVTVVGGGIAGLWTAKELIGRGHSVNLVERSSQLAAGATTRNEGWLHAGTYHSVAIQDEADAARVTARTIEGHDSIVEFAPESIDHEESYAFIRDEALVQEALRKWSRLGVQFREMPQRRFADEGFDIDRISAAFAVKDKSVNTVVLCQKLARFILENGGRIFLGAEYRPMDEGVAEIVTKTERHALRSDVTIVSAGAGTGRILEEVTGKPSPMRYFKSHLLVAPRLSEDNFFYVDPMEAGLMSHGDGTIVGINREAIELTEPDYATVPQRGQMLQDALDRMLPNIRLSVEGGQLRPIACVKVDVLDEEILRTRQSRSVPQDLNIKVFEPAANYICAIPGKMTEAPILARAAADFVEAGKTIGKTNVRSPEITLLEDSVFPITDRPIDIWSREQLEREDVS